MDIQTFIDALWRVVTDIVRVIPQVVGGLILLVLGLCLALLVRWIVAFLLRRLGFDRLMERIGLTDGMRSIGVTAPISTLLAQALFLLLALSFAATAMQVMGLTPIAQLLNQILIYLPSIVGAVIVFLLGGLAAKYVGDMVARVGKSSGLGFASTFGRIIQSAITMFVIVLALSSLGIDTSILVTVLTIGTAGFALALGLSLGLGARTLVHNILSSYYVRERFPVGRTVRVGTVTGQVREIGSVNTVVVAGEDIVVIPNATLIEAVVRGQDASPSDTSSAPDPSA